MWPGFRQPATLTPIFSMSAGCDTDQSDWIVLLCEVGLGRELQTVLAIPAVEKRAVAVLQDCSGRRVDMTEIRRNLFIGDECVITTNTTKYVSDL